VVGSAVRRSRPVTADAREIKYQASPPSVLAGANAFTGHQDSIRGQYTAVFLQGLLLTRIGTTQRLLDFEHRGGLHDFLDPRRIVHARKLNENLILAEAMFLNHRLAHAQLVDSIADRLDGLG